MREWTDSVGLMCVAALAIFAVYMEVTGVETIVTAAITGIMGYMRGQANGNAK